MSMSQEEIESLMNGLDFEDDSPKQEPESEEQPIVNQVEEVPQNDKVEEPATSMSEDDINSLIAETEEIVNNKDEDLAEESVDDILNSLEEASNTSDSSEESVDDILKEVEAIEDTSTEETTETSIPIVEEPVIEKNTEEIQPEQVPEIDENIDDILASIDGLDTTEPESSTIQEETSTVEETIKEEPVPASEGESEDLDFKISSGVFPFPVEQDTKVVNQLSQVANDSEEKATKIFDVLSNILDYNNEIQSDVQELTTFSEKQTAMLSSLNQKFPNIEAFRENLEQAEKMASFISDINAKLNDGNMEIFQAMELMQYHDINRQKIERVMSVIRKLTVYLNNLFEDDGDHAEVAVAKHIHGDSSTGDLMAEDDLDALIAEFNK